MDVRLHPATPAPVFRPMLPRRQRPAASSAALLQQSSCGDSQKALSFNAGLQLFEPVPHFAEILHQETDLV